MRLTEQAHQQMSQVLHPGDTAVDATAGNGHDTLAMAELVGPSGNVIAIDLQAKAIESTRARLEAAGQLEQCELVQGDHAEVLELLRPTQAEAASVITFNLGYLPGGDKAITTSPARTLHALNAATALLKKGGLLLVTAYRGHEGGMAEASEVESWMRSLPTPGWQIDTSEPKTRDPERIPPVLWVAGKK